MSVELSLFTGLTCFHEMPYTRSKWGRSSAAAEAPDKARQPLHVPYTVYRVIYSIAFIPLNSSFLHLSNHIQSSTPSNRPTPKNGSPRPPHRRPRQNIPTPNPPHPLPLLATHQPNPRPSPKTHHHSPRKRPPRQPLRPNHQHRRNQNPIPSPLHPLLHQPHLHHLLRRRRRQRRPLTHPSYRPRRLHRFHPRRRRHPHRHKIHHNILRRLAAVKSPLVERRRVDCNTRNQ